MKASPGGLNHIPLEQGHIWYKHDPVPKEPGLIPAAEPQSSPRQGELSRGFDCRHPQLAGDRAGLRAVGAGGEVHSFVLSTGSPSLSWPGWTLPGSEPWLSSPQAGNGRREELPFSRVEF